MALCIGLFFNTPFAWGQCPTSATPASQVGGFALDRYKICVGETVSVTSTASVTGDGYNFNYDNSPITSDFPLGRTSPAYTQPGTYTVLQASSGPKLACRTVEVVSTTATVGIDVKVCGGVATLTYTLAGDAAKYDRIQILWGDGGSDNPKPTGTTGTVPHTYQVKPAPASYTIQVRGLYDNISCPTPPTTKSVTISNSSGTALPVIKTLTSSDTQIELTYQDPAASSGGTVELLRREQPGSYVSAGTLPNTTGAYTVVDAPASKITCFQLVARDGCNAAERRSSEVCSLKLNAQSADNAVNLTWAYTAPTAAAIRRHEIRRGNSPVFSGSFGALSYTDRNNIECGQQYCYRQYLVIQNSNTSSDTQITSASVCVTGTDAITIAGPTAAFVSVNSSGGVDVVASLSASAPTTYSLIVARADGPGGPFTNLASVDNNRIYADASAQTNRQSYCYQTALLNACGNRSAFTKPACTVYLQTGPDGKTLQWTGDSPFFPDGQPVKYTIVPVDAATGGTLPPIDPPANATSYKIDATNQSTRFYIAAYDKDGVLVSYSNTVDIQLAPSLLIPTAFSPNGDGTNNSFMPQGLFWETLDMTVFDRWGSVVFNTTSKDSTGWDGTINGNPAPTGYYTYRVRITDVSGRAYERAGRVMLLR